MSMGSFFLISLYLDDLRCLIRKKNAKICGLPEIWTHTQWSPRQELLSAIGRCLSVDAQLRVAGRTGVQASVGPMWVCRFTSYVFKGMVYVFIHIYIYIYSFVLIWSYIYVYYIVSITSYCWYIYICIVCICMFGVCNIRTSDTRKILPNGHVAFATYQT